MDKKITLAIAAHNAEKNITAILHALLLQQCDSFTISQIIVHSDQSTDETVRVAKQVCDPSINIKVIESPKRRGFAGSVQYLLSIHQDDIIILFNDDIKITDKQLLKKLLKPFQSQENVGMVCGSPRPLFSFNFVERANISGFNWWYKMRLHIPNGGDGLSVDGKIMALSKEFIEKLTFPSDLAQAGNVDSYIYFHSQKSGFKYIWVPSAEVYYRNPDNFKEHFSWAIRNQTWRFLMPKHFGDMAKDKSKGYPKYLYWKYLILESVKNPFGMLLILGGSKYVIYEAKKKAKNFTVTWDVITTSKNLA